MSQGFAKQNVYDAVPIGTSVEIDQATAPTGFLACDGSAVSRTTYADLFNVIGTTFGVGDGSTTFNLPKETLLAPAPCGRLTLSSTLAVPGDLSSQGTLYYLPFNGNVIHLYASGVWWPFVFTAPSLSLTITSGNVYDVFAYVSNGVVTLELSAAWNSATTRFASGPYATVLPTQDGVWVKSTNGTSIDATRRYIGTIYASGTNVTSDAGGSGTTGGQRFVWNAYNRVRKNINLYPTDGGSGGYPYSTNTWRQVHANTANKVEAVFGFSAESVFLYVLTSASNTGGNVDVAVGVGVDSTSSNSAGIFGGIASTVGENIIAYYDGTPGLGYHAFNMLEAANSAGTTSWFLISAQATNVFQGGMNGAVWC